MSEGALRIAVGLPQESRGAVRRREIFQEAVAAIEESYEHCSLTVAELARNIFTSKRQLQRAFAEAGTSFQETLHAVRMERAAQLLVESSLPVTAIAPRVGYRQPTQFAKAFKRYYELAPTQLRRMSMNHHSSEDSTMECKCGCCDPAPPSAAAPLSSKRDEHERDLERRLEQVDRRLQALEKAA